MSTPNRHHIQQAAHRLSEILGVPSIMPSVKYEVRNRDLGVIDAVFESGPYSIAIEWNSSGSLGRVAHAIDIMSRTARDLPDSLISLLVVPFMGNQQEHTASAPV